MKNYTNRHIKYKFNIGDRVIWNHVKSFGFVISRAHDGFENIYTVEWDPYSPFVGTNKKNTIDESELTKDEAYHKMKDRDDKLKSMGI